MSRLGFNKSAVYHGEVCLGELDVVSVRERSFQFPNNEIRIHHLSPLSERCPPLSVLLTISSVSVRCKLESSSLVKQPLLIDLHASCFYELKTAVVLLGDEEVHLVAMPSKQKKFPCFWCCVVPARLYDSCLGMLNKRCLAIVFDLDETLIVANTMKSFEDRIEVLTGWIAQESDPVRVSGMTSELKRYVEDRTLLKQYIEGDVVSDNGKMYNVKFEEVPTDAAGNEHVVRPVIRLPEKNIVLTRINPEIRDTSVLVRLRPAWEDLRSYLIAKGRKRFEVFVCTMAERDYALEMWRLLDPEAHLIGTKQLLNRIVCVKSGSWKSLLNVFQDGNCHPRMAMVIDDRLKVWEEKDQPRVHVVPAFTPYYAPQAETANAVPVLCVARNVACNVRGGFFKEFDENLLRRLSELFYEDEVLNLPSGPDVSNYLLSEDASFVPNSNANAPMIEGMNGPEVAHRLSMMDAKSVATSASVPGSKGVEVKSDKSQQSVPTTSIYGSSNFKSTIPSEKPSLLGAPFRRENSFGYRGSGDPPLLSRLPVPLAPPPVQTQRGWFVEEDRGYMNRTPVPEAKNEESLHGYGMQKKNSSPASQIPDLGGPLNQPSHSGKHIPTEGGKLNLLTPSISIGVLQEIGQRCGYEVEFRSIMSSSKDLQFSFEVLFTGEKIGVGMGKTRKDAQQQAAENALRCLADKYVSYMTSNSGAVKRDFDKQSLGMENGFLWETNISESEDSHVKDGLPVESTSEAAEARHSSNLENQPVDMQVDSLRLPESNPNKRLK